jgi:predicted deacetylase
MRTLIVSVHDVTPLTLPVCDVILTDLNAIGVHSVSLLIVPNFHGRARIEENKPLRRWLEDKVDLGYEPVLHGYFHLRERKSTDIGITRLTTQVYTSGEGEFYDLSREEAYVRLQKGLADLAFLQRKINGFIAPGWLLSYAAEAAVRQLGFAYTTSVRAVKIFEGVRRIASRSLVWSTRSSWRRRLSLAWNRELARQVEGLDLVRIGIHPTDWTYNAIRAQALRLTDAAQAGREVLTYENFVARHLSAVDAS